MAAEYIAQRGNLDIVLCERGIRTFETATRNTLDISAVPVAHDLSHLPVIVDPSHSGGRRDLVVPLSRAAIAVGRRRHHRRRAPAPRAGALRRAAGAGRRRPAGARRRCPSAAAAAGAATGYRCRRADDRTLAARSTSSSPTSRWVTSRRCRRSSRLTSTPSSRQAATTAAASVVSEDDDVGLDRRPGRRRPVRPLPPPRPAGGPARGRRPAGRRGGRARAARRPRGCRPGASRRRAACARHGRARRVAADDASSEPTGAPRPFDRHTDTVSNSPPYVASGTPLATCAFHSRAPSRCSARPADAVTSRSRRRSSSGWTVPPPKLWVFSTTTAAVDTKYGPASGRISVRDRVDVDQAAVSGAGAGRDAGEGGRGTELGPHDVGVGVAEQLLPRLDEQPDAELVGHRAGRGEQGRLVAEQLGDPALQLGRRSGPRRRRRLRPRRAAIAARIAGVGRVTVSLRRSISSGTRRPYAPLLCTCLAVASGCRRTA